MTDDAANDGGVPEGYKEVPPEDRAKAKSFFEHGRKFSGTGNFEYAIEMYMNGLNLDPDDIGAHQELRDLSIKRKVSGGKPMGMFDGMKFKRGAGDDKTNMLNGEKLMAFEPGNTDYMLSIMQSAFRAGYYDTVMWIAAILLKANSEDKKPDFKKYILLRDHYKMLKQWKLASDACSAALKLKPNDMELSTEVKNLGAMDTMESAGYSKGGSFRDQVRDKSKQDRLLASDKDYADMNAHAQMIALAEGEFRAEPNDPGKAMKYVEALERTEHPDYENKAIEVLEAMFGKTQQFRFRQRVGMISMKQLSRMERSKRAAVQAEPTNENLKKEYAEFLQEKLEYELKEYSLASEAYPTDMKLRFEIARRLYELKRYNDAIPIFQLARNDPKYRNEASLQLGLCFLQAGYIDEAIDTLTHLSKDVPNMSEGRSKDIFYWLGRAHEHKGNKAEAIACYSKVAQIDFNYRDVQIRIKKLRA